MSFNVFNVVEFRGKWIVDINSNEFPICFSLIKQCHCSKNLDLLNLSRISNFLTNLTNINGIIITLCLSFRVRHIGILPSLLINLHPNQGKVTYLRNSSISKWIPMMRKTIPDKTQFALLNILFDGIVILLFGNFLFCICPSRNLDDHVENLGTCSGSRG